MNRWTKAAVVVGVVVVVGATGAFAFGRGMGGPRFFKHMLAMRVEQAEDYVGATPVQRKQIDAAKDAIVAKLEARIQAHQGEREQWLALLTADTIDANAIYAKVDAKADEAKAVAREVVPELIKIHGALTKEQRLKLVEHAKAMHGRGHGPGGFGPGGHHGPGGPGGFGGPGDQE